MVSHLSGILLVDKPVGPTSHDLVADIQAMVDVYPPSNFERLFVPPIVLPLLGFITEGAH